jgi:hypothetical protein
MLTDLIGNSFTCSDRDAWNRAWAWRGGRFAGDKSEHLEKQTKKTAPLLISLFLLVSFPPFLPKQKPLSSNTLIR